MPAVTHERVFTVPEWSVERAEHWKDNHGPCDTERDDRFQWRFSDSMGGLGTNIQIACLTCGAHLDVTDYDSW